MGRCTRDGSRLAVRVEDLLDEEIDTISRATITEGRPYDLDDLEEDDDEGRASRAHLVPIVITDRPMRLHRYPGCHRFAEM